MVGEEVSHLPRAVGLECDLNVTHNTRKGNLRTCACGYRLHQSWVCVDVSSDVTL